MKVLSKDEIVKVSKPKVKEIEVPEWEGSVLIKSLSAFTVLQLSKLVENNKPKDDYYFSLIAHSVVDANGESVFTVEEAREIESTALNTILIEILDFNKLNPEAVQKAKEELKNLRDSSTTD